MLIQTLIDYGMNPSSNIQLFIFLICNIIIQNLVIPNFSGKAIFSIQMNSNINASLLNISNVNSQTDERGCLIEIYSNSNLCLIDSLFIDFFSNNPMIFSFMSSMTLNNVHFHSIYLNTLSNDYETCGILNEKSQFIFNNSTITDYNYEFLYNEETFVNISNCNFSIIDYYFDIFSIYISGCAIELAWSNTFEISNCLFFNLTNSDVGSVIYL